MLYEGYLSEERADFSVVRMNGIAVMHHAHIHPHWELYFCPDNISQSSVINGEVYTYKYPCAVLVSPYSVHSMSCLESEGTDYERYVYYFRDETLEALGERLLPCRMLESRQGIMFELDEAQAAYLKEIAALAESGTYGLNIKEKELMLGVFINKLFDFCDESRITMVGTTSFYIQDVLRYISEQVHNPSNASDIAKHFAVSRSKLDRDFKNSIGMSVHDFSDICRLNYAKKLLSKHKNMSVLSVSDACGFKNETYFFAFFKKHTGISPSEFRRSFERIDETERQILP